MTIILGLSDVSIMSMGKQLADIELVDFQSRVTQAVRRCDICVYQEKEDGEMKILKQR